MTQRIETVRPGTSYVCSPIVSTPERASRWNEILCSHSFDASLMMLSTEEAQLTPGPAVAARRQILMSTYDGDYHTDVVDLDRLSSLVQNGKEKIFFWGAPDEIAHLRDSFSARSLDAERYRSLKLGTATFIDHREFFGAPVWELSRTGSVSRDTPALAPNVNAILRHFQQNRDCGKIFATPRNRAAAAGAKSGVAIQRMHQREINSAFLGFAPWYVMQLGEIELLDYREILRNPDRKEPQAKLTVPIGSFDSAECGFVDALFSGLGCEASLKVGIETCRRSNNKFAGWMVEKSANMKDQCFQPVFLRLSMNGMARCDLGEILRSPFAISAACIVLRIEFVDQTPEFTEFLRNQGFALSAIETPNQGERSWTAVWARPRPDTVVAPPYYAKFPRLNANDEVIVKYLTHHVRKKWTRLRFDV